MAGLPRTGRGVGRGGFTLLEIVLVVLIMGLAAAVVTLRLQGPVQRAQMNDVIGQVVEFDRLTRYYAQRHGTDLLVSFDTQQGQLVRLLSDGQTPVGQPLQLPPRFSLGALRVRGAGGELSLDAIPYSRDGLSPSWALRVDSGKLSRWVLLPGLSGLAMELQNEREVADILETVAGADPG